MGARAREEEITFRGESTKPNQLIIAARRELRAERASNFELKIEFARKLNLKYNEK